MRLSAALALVAGCGRLGFEPVRGTDSQREDAETFFDASNVCGAIPFNDGFDDGVVGDAWNVVNGTNVIVEEVGGQLSISPWTMAASYGWYESVCFADNRNRLVSARIGGVPNSTNGVQMYLMIDLDDQNTLGLQFQTDVLYGFRRAAGVYSDRFSLPFDPVAHRHWRIGGEAGNVVWDTSADGMAWTRHASELPMFDLSNTRYHLVVGAYQDNPAPGTGSFDWFAVR